MRIRWRTVTTATALSAVVLTAQTAGALQLRPLHARDVPVLLQTPHTRPLIVEVWSLDCSYCCEDIAHIAQWWHTARKNVDVAMVSTDGPDQTEMLNRVLVPLTRDGKIDAACMPQYANVEGMPEHLRAVPGPGWQGETPHTITLCPDGRRYASSGLLMP